MDSSACGTAPNQTLKRRRRGRIIALVILLLVIVAVIALFGPATVRVLSLAKRAARLRAIMNAPPADQIGEESRRGLLTELSGIERDLDGLRSALRWFLPLAPRLEAIPYLGGTLASVPHFLDVGSALCSAGIATLEGAESFVPVLLDTSTDESVTAGVTRSLVASRAHFASAERGIERAISARERFSEARLIPPVANGVEAMDRLLPLALGAFQFAQIAPDLLGTAGPRTYLIVAQNNDELRATGGFISGIGLATIKDGELIRFDFQDSYAVENWDQPHPDPPESLRKYMMADLWATRDANWWPDFPTSARALEDLYELNQGAKVDGVIATDLKGLEYIVMGLEPLTLGEDGEPITAANLQNVIRELWSPPPGVFSKEWTPEMIRWWAQRKDFMPALSAAMLAKLQDPSSVDWGKLVWSLKRSLEEKHLLAYFNDPEWQSVLVHNGWDGALSSTPGDYLMVVDSNVGFTKVNPNIEQRIRYEVEIDLEGRSRGIVTLEYHSKVTRALTECLQISVYEESYELMTQRCYWDYLRVYVPLGSELVSASGEAEFDPPMEECGKTMFSAFFSVAPQETKRIVFEYTLPPRILLRDDEGDRYHLIVQKQPGTLSPALQVEVSLPGDVGIAAVSPSPSERTESHLVYDLSLRTDLALALRWK